MATIDPTYQRLDRRYNATSPLLQFAHRRKFEKIIDAIDSCEPTTLIDVGRGGSVDGVAGVLAAKRGYRVTITNTDEAYLEATRRFAIDQEVDPARIQFLINDPQSCDVLDSDRTDLAISLHVLEHLKDFDAGIRALRRVTRRHAIIAMPTCLSPCVWVRLGGGECYRPSPKNFAALWIGLLKVGVSVFKDGVVEQNRTDEGDIEDHLWRYPWVMRAALRRNDFRILRFQPDTLSLPWFEAMLPLARYLDSKGHYPVLRELGYGSHAIVEKKKGG